MSFIEFLLEYYIYILSVLVVLIVGVIGFLVDSKNKEKKKNDNVEVKSNEATITNRTVENISQGNQTVVDNGMNNMQPQVDNMGLNQAINSSVNNNLDAVMPTMDVTPNLDVDATNLTNIQPIMTDVATNTNQTSIDNVNINNTMVNPLDVNNGLNSIQNIQPEVVSVVNSQPIDTNMGVVNTPVVDNLTNIQPIMSEVVMDVSPIPAMMSNNDMNNLNQANVINNSIQNIQPEVIPVNPIPVNNVNMNNGMVNNLGIENGINNMQPIQQPVVLNNSVDSIGVNPVLNNVNPTMVNQNDALVQPQMNMGINSMPVNNNPQVAVNSNPTIQNNNVVNPTQNAGNLQNNNGVYTSDGSQPFDISSMFANNQ